MRRQFSTICRALTLKQVLNQVSALHQGSARSLSAGPTVRCGRKRGGRYEFAALPAVNAVRRRKRKAHKMLSPPHDATSPTGLCQERRRNVAAVRRTDFTRGRPTAAMAEHDSALRNSRQNLPCFSAIHRAYFAISAVDNCGGRRLYKPSWRAAAWRDGAFRKPLTVSHGDRASGHAQWPCSRRCVGCVGFRRLRDVRTCRRTCQGRRRREAPGCLTSESEERETWTAESLRAASSNGEGFGFFRKRAAMEETSAVDVLGQHCCREGGRREREQSRERLCAREQEWDLVKRVISRDQSPPT